MALKVANSSPTLVGGDFNMSLSKEGGQDMTNTPKIFTFSKVRREMR